MTEYADDIKMAEKLAREVDARGGTAYYVGGFVRDMVMGNHSKDIDIEIHGITPAVLESILDSLGRKMSRGESFGIYALGGYSLDIAMPRHEKMRGSGHRDFDVCVDPFCGTESAAKRRDFTVNALMQNVLTGEITDEFGGLDDIEKRVMRHISAGTFGEDALRVLRAAQLAARLDFTVAPETMEICSRMDLSSLSKERVEGEMSKALLKADRPSAFFEVLRDMGQLDCWFPEIRDLTGVEQNRKYHLEGDVWKHTMMVIDSAVQYRDRTSYPCGFMVAALVHDFGKALCTETVDGVTHSYGHEHEGIPVIKGFLDRITGNRKLKKYVLNLAENHMRPNVAAGNRSSVKATNRMFDDSVDPEALIFLGLSDGKGKIPTGYKKENEEFLLERLETYREYMERPHVTGDDIIESGVEPGKGFSELLEYAHKLRLAGVEKDSALKQVMGMAGKIRR